MKLNRLPRPGNVTDHHGAVLLDEAQHAAHQEAPGAFARAARIDRPADVEALGEALPVRILGELDLLDEFLPGALSANLLDHIVLTGGHDKGFPEGPAALGNNR